ncbi:Transcriptional regulator, AraC family [Lysobacter dokdonensis DS-58]|uniref:Transcriptional regulator, AraC family n=1 Tax=Lysobacter dokdonensis DS-58 TaxID=1300345 RepID=A0A0A2X0L6_9GAMM|nr:AraC family transcriptional regulator [Lysobacter dokdonensis]KGQ18759.1 Transcriptional regulator, AraC family [Lysobacter dokdonensis DS-58]
MTQLRKRPVAGIGRVIGWPGGSVWIGRHLAAIQDHAHHAIQISLAMDAGFRIQAAGWPVARETRGIVVMPDRRHRFDGCGASIATIFVEPNSRRGAALRARFAGEDIGLLSDVEAHEAVRFLHAQYDAAAPDAVMAQYAQGAICRIAGDPQAAPADDARITAALQWLRERLASPIRLDDVAAAVHLSPSRFRHLFVAQTGTSLRAWLLWARMERAVESAFQGRSWTEAAHESGFADAAHLTRTCRRVFGLSPTMLVQEDVGRN